MIILFAVLFVACVIMSGFFSGSETGVYCVNPVRLRLESQLGNSVARRLERLLSDRSGLLAVILIGNNIANYLTTMFAALLLTALWNGLSDHEVEVYTTIILTPIILVFGEIFPKNTYQERADRLMAAGSLPLSILDKLFRMTGAVAALTWLARKILEAFGRGESEVQNPRTQVALLLKESAADGVVTDQQSDLIDRVLHLSRVRVGAVMIPSARVATLRAGAGRAEVLTSLERYPHTRYPVIGPDPRKVIGIVDAYEFLLEPHDTIDEVTRDVMRLSARAPVSLAMRHMREAKQTFGIVVDRWDNCIGVVSIKDLVEEIVGDLQVW